jgi:hypothetical protein
MMLGSSIPTDVSAMIGTQVINCDWEEYKCQIY